MLHVAQPASDFIQSQVAESQKEILRALKAIEEKPLRGEHLPFPWVPGTLCYATAHYFITYRLTDSIPEVAAVTKMPSQEDINRVLRKRRS